MHEAKKNVVGLYDFEIFSKRGPEDVPKDDMERMVMYADGTLPDEG